MSPVRWHPGSNQLAPPSLSPLPTGEGTSAGQGAAQELCRGVRWSAALTLPQPKQVARFDENHQPPEACRQLLLALRDEGGRLRVAAPAD